MPVLVILGRSYTPMRTWFPKMVSFSRSPILLVIFLAGSSSCCIAIAGISCLHHFGYLLCRIFVDQSRFRDQLPFVKLECTRHSRCNVAQCLLHLPTFHWRLE